MGERYVALLRGVNVGGKNMLPMKELAGIFAGAGCREVRTYIQSGNVLFEADGIDGLGERVGTAIAGRFGFQVPVVVRSAAEMGRVLKANPFVKAGVAAELLHVSFLAHRPAPEAVKALDRERSPGDTYAVVGQEIYLHLPNGTARSKLTNVYFDRQLSTISTLRNWRTVGVLAGMLKA